MQNKTPSGVEFFDHRFGGVHEGRAMFLTGARGAGKSIFCLQFLKQGLEMNQPALILSARSTRETARSAAKIGIDVDKQTRKDRLFIMNYGDVVNENGREQDIMLPTEGFIELKDLIERKGIERVALDTVLPWMNLTTRGHLAEHIFSFVRAFERMKATVVFTLFHPVSPGAWKMYSLLEEAVPVVASIDYDAAAGTRYWRVVKYDQKLEEDDINDTSLKIRIDPAVGVVPMTEGGEDWRAVYQPPEEAPKDTEKEDEPRKSAFVHHSRFSEHIRQNSSNPWTESENSDGRDSGEITQNGQKKEDEEKIELRPEKDAEEETNEDLRTPFSRAMFGEFGKNK